MIQNIKVDLIYYATSSDFEMEFNLCGCCRMRLLSDKAADRKSFVNALSKAVSRSKVIIACGCLFGAEGIINTVAAAIGKTVVTADNKAYGINSEENIGIIDGSVPLVTTDGIFGGCIIECGPQTIIALTDSKSVKKAILKNLIHPYISELSIISEKTENTAAVIEQPAKEVSEEADEAPTEILEEEPAEEEAEETVTEETETEAEETEAEDSEANDAEVEDAEVEDMDESADDKQDTAEEESVEDTSEGFTFITETEEEPEEEAFTVDFDIDMHLEAETPKRDAKSYYEYFVPNSEEDIYIPEEEEFDNLKPASSKLTAPIIIIAVLLVIMLAVIGYFLLFIPLTSGQEISTYINEFFSVSQNTLV